jgi:hypothetical protein
MQKVDANTLAANQRQKWSAALLNRETFSKMEQGLTYSRTGLERSFKGTDYDILTIVGPYVETNPITGERTTHEKGLGPLIIELNLEL